MTEIPQAVVTDRDVYITRSFNAPRETVWKFWTDPERLAEWFGPAGIHTPVDTIEVDLRAGGSWNLGMTDDATGEVYAMTSHITVAIPPEYLEMVVGAQTSIGELENVILRVQFHDHGAITRMTLHQGPLDDQSRDLTTEGWNESFLKLDTIFGGPAA